MTSSIHPLYLPPAVCWLNRTCAQVQRVRINLFNVLEVISTVLVSATLFAHMCRLWNLFAWGVLGALWSLAVCIALISGCVLTILSSDRRQSARVDSGAITDTTPGVSVSQKFTLFIFSSAAWICTWLYYKYCGGTEVVVSWVDCSANRGPALFPILTWTTFVFGWINAIGFARLQRSD